jgi:hypothetical protein
MCQLIDKDRISRIAFGGRMCKIYYPVYLAGVSPTVHILFNRAGATDA